MHQVLHWVFHALAVLLFCLVIGALGFGVVYFYRLAQAETAIAAQAPVLTKALEDLRRADAAAAGADASRHSTESSDAFRLGVKVGRQTVYRPPVAPGVQSETDPHLIRQLLGQE